jgi:hypothetical protein
MKGACHPVDVSAVVCARLWIYRNEYTDLMRSFVIIEVIDVFILPSTNRCVVVIDE